MTLLAVAVAGRGLVDPAEPVFLADDEALLRGGAAFETMRVYGGRPFLLGRAPRRGFRFSAARLALAGAGRRRGARRARRARRRRTACCASTGPRAALVATAAALPGELEDCARAASRSQTFDVGRAARCSPASKSTSYAFAFAARREAERAGADDAVFVGGRPRARGARPRTSGGGAATTLFTPADRRGRAAGRHARIRARARAGTREGAFTLADLLAADEAFTTSSIREVMPVVAVDGAGHRRRRPGPAAARLQDALRLRSAS